MGMKFHFESAFHNLRNHKDVSNKFHYKMMKKTDKIRLFV